MKKTRPNILLIMSDQHRFDCMGAYGNQEIKTPHLDELSAESVVYENSFCAAPVCTPSRYSLMTGLYPHQHQGYSNHSTIPAGIETFPRILQKNGYKTKAVGKMHFTPTYLNLGFIEMELAEQNGSGRYEDDYHNDLMSRNLIDRIDVWDQVKEYRNTAPQIYWDNYGALESNLPEEHHSTAWIGNKALTSLDEWEENEQNLLMVSFIKPHHPFDPPKPWSEMYDPDKLTLLPGWTDECLDHDIDEHKGFFPHRELTEKKLKKVMSCYYASISHFDNYVGRMLQKLRDKGLYDNTVIIYTSDHGEYMGFHHLLLKNNHMYDPLSKVPLLIKYRKHEGRVGRSDQLVNNIDLAPTILGQAGCPCGEFMSGLDISQNSKERPFIFSEQGRGRAYMVRSKTHKLLLNRDESKSLFFDLQKDPLEIKNLFNEKEVQSSIQDYQHALNRMILFESPPPSHVHKEAAEIKLNKGTHKLKEWVRTCMSTNKVR